MKFLLFLNLFLAKFQAVWQMDPFQHESSSSIDGQKGKAFYHSPQSPFKKYTSASGKNEHILHPQTYQNINMMALKQNFGKLLDDSNMSDAQTSNDEISKQNDQNTIRVPFKKRKNMRKLKNGDQNKISKSVQSDDASIEKYSPIMSTSLPSKTPSASFLIEEESSKNVEGLKLNSIEKLIENVENDTSSDVTNSQDKQKQHLLFDLNDPLPETFEEDYVKVASTAVTDDRMKQKQHLFFDLNESWPEVIDEEDPIKVTSIKKNDNPSNETSSSHHEEYALLMTKKALPQVEEEASQMPNSKIGNELANEEQLSKRLDSLKIKEATSGFSSVKSSSNQYDLRNLLESKKKNKQFDDSSLDQLSSRPEYSRNRYLDRNEARSQASRQSYRQNSSHHRPKDSFSRNSQRNNRYRLDSSPRRDTPHRRGSSPHRRDSTPHRRDSTPHRRDPTPHRRGSSPHRRDSSPPRRDSTPHRRDSSPHRPNRHNSDQQVQQQLSGSASKNGATTPSQKHDSNTLQNQSKSIAKPIMAQQIVSANNDYRGELEEQYDPFHPSSLQYEYNQQQPVQVYQHSLYGPQPVFMPGPLPHFPAGPNNTFSAPGQPADGSAPAAMLLHLPVAGYHPPSVVVPPWQPVGPQQHVTAPAQLLPATTANKNQLVEQQQALDRPSSDHHHHHHYFRDPSQNHIIMINTLQQRTKNKQHQTEELLKKVDQLDLGSHYPVINWKQREPAENNVIVIKPNAAGRDFKNAPKNPNHSTSQPPKQCQQIAIEKQSIASLYCNRSSTQHMVANTVTSSSQSTAEHFQVDGEILIIFLAIKTINYPTTVDDFPLLWQQNMEQNVNGILEMIHTYKSNATNTAELFIEQLRMVLNLMGKDVNIFTEIEGEMAEFEKNLCTTNVLTNVAELKLLFVFTRLLRKTQMFLSGRTYQGDCSKDSLIHWLGALDARISTNLFDMARSAPPFFNAANWVVNITNFENYIAIVDLMILLTFPNSTQKTFKDLKPTMIKQLFVIIDKNEFLEQFNSIWTNPWTEPNNLHLIRTKIGKNVGAPTIIKLGNIFHERIDKLQKCYSGYEDIWHQKNQLKAEYNRRLHQNVFMELRWSLDMFGTVSLPKLVEAKSNGIAYLDACIKLMN